MIPGSSVSWSFEIKGVSYKRYGCVLSKPTEPFANQFGVKENELLIQASNAKLGLPPERLTLEPGCNDPITADQKEIYK